MADLASWAWAALAAVALWRVDVWMRARVGLRSAFPNVEVSENTPDISDKPTSKADVPLPVDLESYAARESEPWAREQHVAALRDLYLESRSWDRVRAAVLTGE